MRNATHATSFVPAVTNMDAHLAKEIMNLKITSVNLQQIQFVISFPIGALVNISVQT
jgi:hypothetical protein